MPLVVKPATIAIGEQPQVVKLLRSGLPNAGYVPTLVNPNPTGDGAQKILFWAHLLLQVASLLLSGFSNFAAAILQKKDASCTSLDCFDTDPNGGMIVLGIAGGSCHVIFVVLILFAASIFNAEQYRKYIWLHTLICFFGCFALVCTLFVWASASMRPNSLAFWIATPAAIVQVFSLAMIYSTSSAMGSRNLNRTFIFQLTLALDLMIALAWQTGTFNKNGLHIDPTSKSMMWCAFGFQLAPQIVLLLSRIFTNSKLNIMSISKYPFTRSVVLGLLALSAICASYRFSVSNDPFLTMVTSFSTPATILSYLTLGFALFPDIAIAYAPGTFTSVADEDAPEEMDGDEDVDEEGGEAVEAKYRAPTLVGKRLVR